MTVTEIQTADETASYEKEIPRRAVLDRLRELLAQQGKMFLGYLDVLEKRQNSIESSNAEDLISYVEMEERIVKGIFSIQKVIEPLEDMCAVRDSWFEGRDPLPADIYALKAALEGLKRRALAQSSRNRKALSVRMEEIRGEIDALKNNPVFANMRRPVFQNYNAATLVDIKG